jgi:hypothetical protein
LDDKLYFWSLMRVLSERVAPVLGIVRDGRLVRIGRAGTETVAAGLLYLGGDEGKLVLKPCTGRSGGEGVFTYEWRDGTHLVNGDWADDDELLARFGDEVHIVSPYVRQAEYAAWIFPDVANTIRILTMYDDDAGEAFIAAAVHRFGTRSPGVVDNWGRGGISAGVDLASGRLTRGYAFPLGRELRVCPVHPDTGAAIEGVEIPGWSQVRDGILELADKVPFLPYVGWDVIVTDEAYVVIEGNSRPDVNLMQVHRPLLADERVRRFYARHSIV